MNKQKYVSVLAVGLIAVGLVAAGLVSAQGNQGQGKGMGWGQGEKPGSGQMQRAGIFGTVASINGTTLTVTNAPRPNMGKKATTTAPTPASITYSVDATNAKVTKNNADSTVSAIAVGDTVVVQGTVTGTNVVAKTIRDGVPQNRQEQPAIQGNGQPVVAGKVTAISGNTITISNSSNVAYTIDATSAKFIENGVASPTIANVSVGDNIIVQGTVNGNSVTASSVIDQKPRVESAPKPAPRSGIMGGIGNFFKHLFGF